MSVIKAVFNKNTETWFHQKVSVLPVPSTLEFSFISTEEMTKFDYLEYGFKLISANEIVSEETHTPSNGNGVLFISNSPYHEAPLLLNALTNYTLITWINLSPEHKIEKDCNFLVPAPPQPFPSWTLVGNKWEPPITKPEGSYQWDESEGNWISIAHDYR
jgi:hypothetical protein